MNHMAVRCRRLSCAPSIRPVIGVPPPDVLLSVHLVTGARVPLDFRFYNRRRRYHSTALIVQQLPR
ncbi:hypothetical protein DPMN_021748 [Dreissena polymorpha]|uniref:Uncharacterized protein n=1 Tax=Dreissena polymorpha TaxID=45954 RepID=A0A9D4N544_DREPO|nr:hypothetical protein DPMN_012040 [Dreissena polymorpha]KAH3888021.1 hypothetical protein DPMN_012042 [Dreissena polymorpha]KAH3888023.1 hypothetical protein DPMN_012044 [Dreissena polymorpha]KAH3897560.1 hypothetical protein DPMN_021748 [Dreissena polymorpha]